MPRSSRKPSYPTKPLRDLNNAVSKILEIQPDSQNAGKGIVSELSWQAAVLASKARQWAVVCEDGYRARERARAEKSVGKKRKATSRRKRT